MGGAVVQQIGHRILFAFAIALACASQTFAFCNKSDPFLKLCWEANEGFGTTVKDGSSLGLDGTLTGGPSWVTNGSFQSPHRPQSLSTFTFSSWGGPNQLSFPGTQNIDVRTVNTAVFDQPEFMVLGVTVQPTPGTYPPTTEAAIVGFGDGTALNGGWQLSIPAGGIGAPGTINFRYSNVQNNVFANSGFQNTTHPHRIMVIKSGSASGQKLYNYVDGKPNGTPIAGAAMQSVGAKRVGLSFCDDGGVGNFAGKINNLKIWIGLSIQANDHRLAFAWNDYVDYQISSVMFNPGGVRF